VLAREVPGEGFRELVEVTVQWLRLRDTCRLFRTKPVVYNDNIAAFEGSGGASATAAKEGGSGGGIVNIFAASSLRIENAKVTAEGAEGQNKGFKALGSGGGAGGSILITTARIEGDGLVSARGGNGSRGAGGGGSGGRIVVNLLKSYQASSYPLISSDWRGRQSVVGGEAGEPKSEAAVFSKGTGRAAGNNMDQ